MQTFLQEVVQSELDQRTSDTLFIVPSRRAGSKLRKIIAQQARDTNFAPEIFSIEEFIARVSGLHQATNPDLLFTLFTSYKSVTPDGSQEDFRTFCGWAQTLLGDFNEIDRYLIPPGEIFNYLKDIKDLSNHWSQHTESSLVVNYIKFWEVLPAMYNHFCDLLLEKGVGHQGMVYKQAVENLEGYVAQFGKNRHVFIGFNALNTAESQLIQGILATDNSAIYWDAESHFTGNPIHEASLFVNLHRSEWPYFKENKFNWISKNYIKPKEIKAYACASNILQAKSLSLILENLTAPELEETAIVLSDESLLLPVLNALPKSIGTLNITMGIPLEQTPVATFFTLLLQMKRTVTHRGYYHKEIVGLLSHPLSRKLTNASHILQSHIVKHNKAFVTQEELLTIMPTTSSNEELSQMQLLLQPWGNDPVLAVQNCLELIRCLRTLLTTDEDVLQVEYLFGFYKVFNQLAVLQDDQNYIKDIATLLFFYRDILSAETVDLKGDPEQGLQIMGVLESRVLDFKNVILTSVNEGILPSGKSQNSFIPYDLKRQYGLPTYFEKDAIYAYHFYRLLHRASNIFLLYTTESSGLGSTEKSRFIRQIQHEGIHSIKEYTVTGMSSSHEIPILEITKTPDIVSKLNSLFLKGISPSALTTYLRNPMVFYERYVLGVKERDTVEETVAANTMGTIVHNTLEELYKPLINVVLTPKLLKSLFPKIHKEVKAQFQKEYGLNYISSGKNLIIYEVVCRYIENYLRAEVKKLKEGDTLIIRSLEDDLRDILLTESICLRGKVDLVEERNGDIRIIDYKTGKVEHKDLKITAWEDLLLPEGKYEKAFQVLMYAYMMHKKKPLSFPVSVGIISFKNLKAGYLPFRFDKNELVTEETLQEFEKILKLLVGEILDMAVPFKEREI